MSQDEVSRGDGMVWSSCPAIVLLDLPLSFFKHKRQQEPSNTDLRDSDIETNVLILASLDHDLMIIGK